MTILYTTVVAGTTITAAWGNNVRDGLISGFATAAARTSAVTSPIGGMMSWRTDGLIFDGYDGTGWIPGLPIGPWIDYSSSLTITGSTTNPTKGNSVYLARYTQLGKLVSFAFQINVGTTFSAGSGTYAWSIPVTANSNTLGLGSFHVNQPALGLRVGVLYMASTTTVSAVVSNVSSNPVNSSGPGSAWASGQVIYGAITYEAA